jgi:NAD+ kinase
MARRRVLLLADYSRPEIAKVADELRAGISQWAEIAGELDTSDEPLPEDVEAELAVVIGGDGSLLSQARRVVDRALPLVGVNFGRLGFLAAFDAHNLLQHAAIIFGPDPPITEHMMLAAAVYDSEGEARHSGLAINDCVVTAGSPFRMIELRVSIDDAEGPTVSGDGVIVSTPVGSTAYNVSAGGPIVDPNLEAMVVTPLAAHSLAFRPFVVCPWCTLAGCGPAGHHSPAPEEGPLCGQPGHHLLANPAGADAVGGAAVVPGPREVAGRLREPGLPRYHPPR